MSVKQGEDTCIKIREHIYNKILYSFIILQISEGSSINIITPDTKL